MGEGGATWGKVALRALSQFAAVQAAFAPPVIASTRVLTAAAETFAPFYALAGYACARFLGGRCSMVFSACSCGTCRCGAVASAATTSALGEKASALLPTPPHAPFGSAAPKTASSHK
eukprot:IDg2271t1